MIEQYQDIIENCTAYLKLLKKCKESNDTPEGRLISQLKWLKQEAKAERLPLPVDRVYTSTLRHTYVEFKSYLAKITPKWVFYHKRLLKLANGRLLSKPEHNHIVQPLLTYLITNLPKNKTQVRLQLIDIEKEILSGAEFPLNGFPYSELGRTFYEDVEINTTPKNIQTMEMIKEYCIEGVRDLENSAYIMCDYADVEAPEFK